MGDAVQPGCYDLHSGCVPVVLNAARSMHRRKFNDRRARFNGTEVLCYLLCCGYTWAIETDHL